MIRAEGADPLPHTVSLTVKYPFFTTSLTTYRTLMTLMTLMTLKPLLTQLSLPAYADADADKKFLTMQWGFRFSSETNTHHQTSIIKVSHQIISPLKE